VTHSTIGALKDIYIIGQVLTALWLSWLSERRPDPDIHGVRRVALILWLSLTWPATVIPTALAPVWRRLRRRRRHPDEGKTVTGLGIPPGLVITSVTPGVSFTLSPASERPSWWSRRPWRRRGWAKGYEEKGFTE